MAANYRSCRIFFRGAHPARSPHGVLAALFSASVAAGLLLFVPAMPGYWKALPILAACAAAGVAIWVGTRIWLDAVDRCEISEDGVQVNESFTPWADVRWFYAEGAPDLPSVSLKLSTRRDFGVVGLPARPPLSPQDYECLVAALEDTVGRRFPEVRIGGYMSPFGPPS